jgi:hypothetical protein
MWINEYESEDYEVYATRSLDVLDRRAVFPPAVMAGLKPIVFDGAIPEQSMRELFFPKIHHVPEIRIDLFKDAIVTGSGLIFTSDRRALGGHVPVGAHPSGFLRPWSELSLEPLGDDRFACARLSRVTEIPYAAVIARAAPGNYHHFIADILPRLHIIYSDAAESLMREHNIARDACPILVNSTLNNRAIERLRESGFDAARLRPIPRGGSVRVRKLFVPHVLNSFSRNWASPELFHFYDAIMRRLAIPRSCSLQNDRIFCLRRDLVRDRRRIHNGNEIADLLTAEGFREVSPERMSWKDQMLAFSGARYVVGSFGANNTNMVFSAPSARLLVLHPNDSRYALNVGMCAAGRQEIGYVWAESFSNRVRGEHVEYFVDRDLVRTAIDKLVS